MILNTINIRTDLELCVILNRVSILEKIDRVVPELDCTNSKTDSMWIYMKSLHSFVIQMLVPQI